MHFAVPFAATLQHTHSNSQQAIEQAAILTLNHLPSPDLGRTPVENRDLQLVFRHDCL